MRRTILSAVLLATTVGLAHSATPLYISPDVPTVEGATGMTLLPWEIFRYDTGPVSYTLALTVPGEPSIDAIHKMDAYGDWLLSFERPTDIAGALAFPAEPRDVVLYDGAAYSLFFCGAALGIPERANLDAVHLEGGDTGDLVVSFDVPTALGPFLFEPADLVRFEPAGAGCGAWTLSAMNPAFDASAAGTGVAISRNTIGSEAGDGVTILSFDVPTTVGPPPAQYTPGDLVSWDGAFYALFETLAGWPIRSHVEAVSCAANPGSVPPPGLMIAPSLLTSGDLTLTWSASCSEGGENYGIYEGTIGTWYSHTAIDCDDAGGDLVEEVTPALGNTYYLVVPHNSKEEGSYGLCSPGVCLAGNQRPAGAFVCAAPQVVTPCPP